MHGEGPVTASLSSLDYTVIAGYLLAITAFGAWFSRFQRTTRDYFLSDRSVPWWAVCFTVVATETSTLTFIGIPASAYTGNFTFLQLAAGYVLGRVLVSVVLLPAYFRGNLVTTYQLLQQRFDHRVRLLAAGLFLVTRSLADGIRLFTTALVIAVVTQLPVSLVVVGLGGAMILYTLRGGVAAVIWTDVVQMFVYLAGALLIAVSLLQSIPGGWSTVVATGTSAGRFTVLDASLDLTKVYTLWSGLIGGIALTLATHGTDQFLVQRLLSARTLKAAQAGLVVSGLLVFMQFALFLCIGVMLFVFVGGQASPPVLTRADEVLPAYVVTQLPHGVIGFIVAAIVAAALSPSINAMAATTLTDFYLPYVNPLADESTQMRISRQSTVVWGVVQIGVALAGQWMTRSVLDAGLSVLSLGSGAVLGAFLLGTLWPKVSSRAARWGMLAGLLIPGLLWLFTPIAWTWYACVGALSTVAVALGTSAVTGHRAATDSR
jgi:SSS family transporter